MRISDWSSDVCSSDRSAQIFQVEQQQTLVVGVFEHQRQHRFLHVGQIEQTRQQHRTEVGNRCTHRMTAGAEHIPEHRWARSRRPTSTPTVAARSSSLGLVSPAAAMPDRSPLMSRSEEHTSELQSLMRISYAVFCLKKKNQHNQNKNIHKTKK